MRLPWDIQLQHVYREGNVIADWVAKQGANSNDLFTKWMSCLVQLNNILLAVAMGIARLRL